MIYDAQYYIDKFSAIPEDKWCILSYNKEGKSCALGHCGARITYDNEMVAKTTESLSLQQLLFDTAGINDGHNNRYQQPTPKQRILAALNDVKNK